MRKEGRKEGRKKRRGGIRAGNRDCEGFYFNSKLQRIYFNYSNFLVALLQLLTVLLPYFYHLFPLQPENSSAPPPPEIRAPLEKIV